MCAQVSLYAACVCLYVCTLVGVPTGEFLRACPDACMHSLPAVTQLERQVLHTMLHATL